MMDHTSQPAHAVKAACEAVVLTFFHALDTRRHDAAAALMAGDGVWLRQGQRLCGPQEVPVSYTHLTLPTILLV